MLPDGSVLDEYIPEKTNNAIHSIQFLDAQNMIEGMEMIVQ